jgi:hypothetical protein
MSYVRICDVCTTLSRSALVNLLAERQTIITTAGVRTGDKSVSCAVNYYTQSLLQLEFKTRR